MDSGIVDVAGEALALVVVEEIEEAHEGSEVEETEEAPEALEEEACPEEVMSAPIFALFTFVLRVSSALRFQRVRSRRPERLWRPRRRWRIPR